MKSTIVAAAILMAIPAAPAGDKDKLRDALGDQTLVGPWFYDDLDAAIAEAAKTRKPLLAVLRCVP